MLRILSILLLSLLAATGSDPRPFTFSDQAFLQAALPSSGWTETGYPTNITGYPAVAWYVADSISGSDGDGISSWTDLVGGYNLVQSTAGSQPKLQISAVNGHKAAYFDGTDDWVWNSVIDQPGNQFELFLVLSVTNIYSPFSYQDGMFVSSTNNVSSVFNFGYYTCYAQPAYNAYGDLGGALGPNFSLTNRFFICNLLYGDENAILLKPSTNGVLVASLGPGSARLTGIQLARGVPGSGRYSKQVVAELICYNTNLTSQLRTNVTSYLFEKYAIVR